MSSLKVCSEIVRVPKFSYIRGQQESECPVAISFNIQLIPHPPPPRTSLMGGGRGLYAYMKWNCPVGSIVDPVDLVDLLDPVALYRRFT